MKSNPWRVLAAASLAAAGICIAVGFYSLVLSDYNASQRDFISYWAAGQQLAHGGNPYDFEAVQRLERAAGREDKQLLLIMRNPPVALPLVFPLGFVSPKIGLIFWLLTLLACLSVSIRVLWLLNGRPKNRYHLFGYVFAPVLTCMMAGQFGIFLLLGVVLFLYYHQSRPFLAGAALMLCALKPHLILPCAAVLLLWVVRQKAYQILAGLCAALLASCAFTFCFDAHAWSQYSQMMHTGRALNEVVPTLSATLRLLIHGHAVWLQFLPQAVACCWALWYFTTRRNRWSWMDQGLLLLLVSVMCSPYSFFTDESMLLPAVLAGLYRTADSGRSLLPLGLIAGIALIELFAGVQMVSPFYLWTTPAWLAWYLYATAGEKTRANNLAA
jgi:hypothetical protein